SESSSTISITAPSLIPAGIDSIKPGKAENTLVITGEQAAVDELVAKIRKLDAKPWRIQIMWEFFTVDSETASNLFPDGFKSTSRITKPEDVAALRDRLNDIPDVIVNKPELTTLNGIRANLKIQTKISASENSENKQELIVNTKMSVLPRLNEDGTISLNATATVSSKPAGDSSTNVGVSSQQSFSTSRRINDGETVILGGNERKLVKINIFFIKVNVIGVEADPLG
ncbi:MAG: hypothetical protein NT018_09375, partial [Armatimonadetes bacterium]|nr:hypothetical protein [Armatimonadota bacterium]